MPSNIQCYCYLWLERKVISTGEGDYLLGVKIRVQQFSNMIIKFTLTVIIIIIADGRGASLRSRIYFVAQKGRLVGNRGAGYIDLDFKRTLKTNIVQYLYDQRGSDRWLAKWQAEQV